MANKRNEEKKDNRVPTGQRTSKYRGVNATITLPSAEIPAQPPKGKNKDPKNAPSPVEEESENP